ncbi:MAG TPA: hypothetical protein VI172_04040 [Candidatus Dormibacteraeota bacterium]|jgi:hypothetical protein
MDLLDTILDRITIQGEGAELWRERLDRGRGLLPRNEIQRDLRKWADELAVKGN